MAFGPTITLSIGRKVNLGNFESADVFISVSGITQDMTEADIQKFIDNQGKITFDILRGSLREKMRKMVAPTMEDQG